MIGAHGRACGMNDSPLPVVTQPSPMGEVTVIGAHGRACGMNDSPLPWSRDPPRGATSPTGWPMREGWNREDAKVWGWFRGRHRRLHRGAPTLGTRATGIGVRALRGSRARRARASVRTPAARLARLQGHKARMRLPARPRRRGYPGGRIKCVDRLLPIHKAQLLTYLRLTRLQTGLLVNFHETVLKNGLRRLVSLASSRLPVNLPNPHDHSRDL